MHQPPRSAPRVPTTPTKWGFPRIQGHSWPWAGRRCSAAGQQQGAATGSAAPAGSGGSRRPPGTEEAAGLQRGAAEAFSPDGHVGGAGTPSWPVDLSVLLEHRAAQPVLAACSGHSRWSAGGGGAAGPSRAAPRRGGAGGRSGCPPGTQSRPCGFRTAEVLRGTGGDGAGGARARSRLGPGAEPLGLRGELGVDPHLHFTEGELAETGVRPRYALRPAWSPQPCSWAPSLQSAGAWACPPLISLVSRLLWGGRSREAAGSSRRPEPVTGLSPGQRRFTALCLSGLSELSSHCPLSCTAARHSWSAHDRDGLCHSSAR